MSLADELGLRQNASQSPSVAQEGCLVHSLGVNLGLNFEQRPNLAYLNLTVQEISFQRIKHSTDVPARVAASAPKACLDVFMGMNICVMDLCAEES